MPPKSARKKTGYVLAEKFSSGFILKDMHKHLWTLGETIAQGGFGLIYLASKGEISNVNSHNANYIIKIEPKDNGPLFCELHFYTNCCKDDDIIEFMRMHRLKHVGIPRYIASGLCEHKNKEYRFLVMDRYSKDLQTILNDNNNILNENIVLYLTRQILYALEYIHIKGYAHADIKGANLMLKNDKEIYLVDYGLAHRFSRDGSHQTYTQKPEAKHNGTIEYTSRDAHDGVPPSRRGDLEILLYCIVHWLSDTLPWLDVLENKEEVQKRKIKFMQHPNDFIKFIVNNSYNSISDAMLYFVEFFIQEINKTKFSDEPNYSKLHVVIGEVLSACGYSKDEDFKTVNSVFKKPALRRLKSKENPILTSDDSFDDENYGDEKLAQARQPAKLERPNTLPKNAPRKGIPKNLSHDNCSSESEDDSPKAAAPRKNYKTNKAEEYLNSIAYRPPPTPQSPITESRYSLRNKEHSIQNPLLNNRRMTQSTQSTQTNITCVNGETKSYKSLSKN